MRFIASVAVLLSISRQASAQTDFQVTGTPIPATLLRQNYGAIPKGISAFDLSICNVATAKQSLVSSEVYQALAQQSGSLEPIGRDIMLASIIRNENHSAANILNLVFESATGIFSVVSAARYPLSPRLLTGLALASLTGQQVISRLRPLLSADQLEKFESQVLEPALVLDSGSCVERTVFIINTQNITGKARNTRPANPVSFHIH